MGIFKRYCHICMEKHRKYRKCPNCNRAICRSCLDEMEDVGVTDCPYCNTRIIPIKIEKVEFLPPVVNPLPKAPAPFSRDFTWSKPTPHQFKMMPDVPEKTEVPHVVNWPTVLEYVQRTPTTLGQLYKELSDQMTKTGRHPLNQGTLWTQMQRWVQTGEIRKAVTADGPIWYGPSNSNVVRNSDAVDALEQALIAEVK